MHRTSRVLLACSVLFSPAVADDLVPRLDGCCFIIDFDDNVPGECVSEKYADLGIHMYRPFKSCVWARDLTPLGWWSPSPPMAVSTARDDSEDRNASRFLFEFDRRVTSIRACFGNDGPGMSLEYRCDFPNGWSSGYGPLNGNFDLDETYGATDCDTVWFQDRFGQYAITLDRLQVSFCSAYRSCTVIGDGEPYVIDVDHPEFPDLCARD